MSMFRFYSLLILTTLTVVVQATVLTVDDVLKTAQVATLQDYLAITKLPVVLKFYSPTCPPCNALKPVFEEFSRLYDGKMVCIEINVLVNLKEKQSFHVTRWPTLIFEQPAGKQVSVQVGRKSLQELKQLASTLFGL